MLRAGSGFHAGLSVLGSLAAALTAKVVPSAGPPRPARSGAMCSHISSELSSTSQSFDFKQMMLASSLRLLSLLWADGVLEVSAEVAGLGITRVPGFQVMKEQGIDEKGHRSQDYVFRCCSGIKVRMRG